MQKLGSLLALALIMTGCAQARPPAADLASAADWHLPDASAHLETMTVSGEVRARGWIGFISVPGTLSFADGRLIWEAGGLVDTGPYRVQRRDDGLHFRAEHALENGERNVWHGRYEAGTFHDVYAVWYRVEGDWVHDLLLPEVVVLDFTPAD